MRLAANLSMLWATEPFEQRFSSAARAGFDAVELWWPGDEQAGQLPELTSAHGLQLAALNFDAGDMPAGDRGLLATPAGAERFRAHASGALEIAAACGCTRMNALVGLRDEQFTLDEQLSCVRDNLTWLAPLAARHDVTVLVEQVNSYENGPYLVPTTEEAVALVRSVARDNVRLLYDAYHRARQGGDVLTGLDAHWDLLAHVQVADCPGRNEPGTGTVDYDAFFADLGARGYDGFVGLEYRPTDGDTNHSLTWFREAGFLASRVHRECAVSDGALPAVGFVGLGVMGLPMARNLLAAGYPLTVATRTPARAESLLADGARWAEHPSAAADGSAVVITMLPDSPDVVGVAHGADGLLAQDRPGVVWIDMSSIAPGVTTTLAQEAAARDVRCLDAPVSGGEQGAIDGTLSIMVGGPRDVFDECLSILETLGGSVVHVGDTGAGQITKLCNQMVVGTTIAAVAEALVLAEKASVDPAAVRQVLLGGFAQSKVLDVHGQRMLERNFRPGFRAALHQKDLTNALDAARRSASPSPLTAVVMQLLTSLLANGGGDLDHSALLQVYEALAGEPDGTPATT